MLLTCFSLIVLKWFTVFSKWMGLIHKLVTGEHNVWRKHLWVLSARCICNWHKLIQCGAVITRSIFIEIITMYDPGKRYGVYFVCSDFHLYLASATAVMYAISRYIILRYNGVRLYSDKNNAQVFTHIILQRLVTTTTTSRHSGDILKRLRLGSLTGDTIYMSACQVPDKISHTFT